MILDTSKKLTGKRAVITGGSRGIGEAIARAYLVEGAEVVLVARNEAELAQAQTRLAPLGPVATRVLDVSDQDAVAACAEALAKDGKTIDVVVNAAAIIGPIGKVHDMDPGEWLNALKINMYGTYLMTYYFVPFLQKSSQSSIINFVGGGEGPRPNFSSYISAKGGIARFTETVAEELRDKGIKVNAVAPGAVNTKLLDEVIAAGKDRAGTKEYESALAQKESGGVSPDKVAALAVWLASDASKGVSGRILSAVWDSYETLPEHVKDIEGSDVYTMRRVRPKDRGFTWGEK